MGAENNLGEVLSQLAIKDAGPIAEFNPEQSKLVNTERCFPAIEAIVKFAQDNHARHLATTPDDNINNYSSNNALQFSLEAKKKIESTGVARIHGIAVGKKKLLDQSPRALTRQADGGSGTQQMIDVSVTKDLNEAYEKLQISSPSSEVVRFLYYPEITLSDPSNFDLLVAVKKALKDDKKGVSIRDSGNTGWTTISQNEKLPNTLSFVITKDKRIPVDKGSGSVSVVYEQDQIYDLACFSDAEWERAQLAVDQPDYAARYAYLKSKLSTNDQGESSLREVERNIAVNGDFALRGEISLRDAKLPAVVSAPEGKFIAWRNPARAGQIELIPTTSKDLVERVILSAGYPNGNAYPSAAIDRLQKLNVKDNDLRNSIKPEDPVKIRHEVEEIEICNTLAEVVRSGQQFSIKVDQEGGGILNRDATITYASLQQDGTVIITMNYYSRSNKAWLPMAGVQFTEAPPLADQVRNRLQFVGKRRIVVQ